MKKIYASILLLTLIALLFSCSTESTPVYNLTITANPAEGGSIAPSAGSFEEGEDVRLQATPSEGWLFSRWEQDLNTTANPMNITMNRDYNIVGVFERRTYPLTITIEGNGTVRETILQAKTTDYPEGSIIELEGEPFSDWVFARWEGGLEGMQNPAEITIAQPTTIIAVFNTIPTVSTSEISSITGNSAKSGGSISDDDGSPVTARGVCWSESENPTTDDECATSGEGSGSFTSDLTDLSSVTEYYVRAFATNGAGTAYGNQQSFTTSWARDTETEVVDVTNPATGRTWMDRNLGASRAATSVDDDQSYGDLYQWGRSADGHQKRNSSTTTTLSSSNQPGHGDFILKIGSPRNWRIPQNDNLWQSENGLNNPCPMGYRIPTSAEWAAEAESWNRLNAAGATASPLKLPMAGSRNGTDAEINTGFGGYWSSSLSGSSVEALLFNRDIASITGRTRVTGLSVRCIMD